MARKELSALNVLETSQAVDEAPAPSLSKGLRVRNIARAFGQRKVVQDVSLDVQRGQVVGLLGPNGAGKTTCFYMITGLVPVDEGSIEINGNDVTTMPMYRRARLGVGYLPQEASIFRGMSVADNIRSVLELRMTDPGDIDRRLGELLADFGLTHLRSTPSPSLSGGERRRCEIARALAAEPGVILLDEPFAGIDPISIADIKLMVRDLKRRGVGVLITDHNVHEMLELVDRAYVIHGGKVLFVGKPQELLHHDEVRRLYLGENYED